MSDFSRARDYFGLPTRGHIKKQLVELRMENARLREALAVSQKKLADNFYRAWFDDRANRKAKQEQPRLAEAGKASSSGRP
jgi:hypothetical protein